MSETQIRTSPAPSSTNVRSRRTPRMPPTAMTTAMSRTVVIGAMRSKAATGVPPGSVRR